MRATQVLADLALRGETIACAESLTGGSLMARLVDVPGASRVLRGGVVAYAHDVKAVLLGVPATLLATRGAVDPDVAIAMAAGACRVFDTDWGVATTGVAGPDPSECRNPRRPHHRRMLESYRISSRLRRCTRCPRRTTRTSGPGSARARGPGRLLAGCN